jgi:hypothetical protein
MKRLIFGLVILLMVSGMIAHAHAEDWNIVVKTGPETMPLSQLINLNLTLYAFRISSLAQINDLAFNTSISELSFQAVVTPEDEINGYNILISMPPEILNNSNLVVTNSVDGKSNGYSIINDSTIGFYLCVGTHTVTVDIYDPAVTVPEFQIVTILPLFMLTMLAAIILKRRAWSSKRVMNNEKQKKQRALQ